MSWTTTEALAVTGLDEALARAGASLGTDRPDIQGQRLVELVAWQYGVPLAHALLDGAPLPRLTQVWVGDDAPEPVGAGVHTTVREWRAQLQLQLAPLVDAHTQTADGSVARRRRPDRGRDRLDRRVQGPRAPGRRARPPRGRSRRRPPPRRRDAARARGLLSVLPRRRREQVRGLSAGPRHP